MQPLDKAVWKEKSPKISARYDDLTGKHDLKRRNLTTCKNLIHFKICYQFLKSIFSAKI